METITTKSIKDIEKKCNLHFLMPLMSSVVNNYEA